MVQDYVLNEIKTQDPMEIEPSVCEDGRMESNRDDDVPHRLLNFCKLKNHKLVALLKDWPTSM